MERIAGPGATTDNLFTEGDPSLGIDATTVTANWLNGVQEELIHILEEAGITPDGATLTQVLEALRTLFVRKDVPENMVVRNLLTISALTGNLPANGVFPWASFFVSESTKTGIGAADNTLMIAANAYWDGTKWKRRAGGPSVGIQFLPENYAIHMMDGGSGPPGEDITWTARGNWVLSGQGVLHNVGIIGPSVADVDWTGTGGSITAAVKTRKYPTDSMQVRGFISNVVGISAGATAATISGNPFGLTDGLSVSFFGYNGTAPELWRIKWTMAWGETRLYPVGAVASGSTSRFMVVVPCTGISE